MNEKNYRIPFFGARFFFFFLFLRFNSRGALSTLVILPLMAATCQPLISGTGSIYVYVSVPVSVAVVGFNSGYGCGCG